MDTPAHPLAEQRLDVLLVEDDPVWAEFMRFALARIPGIAIAHAASAAEAEATLDRGNLDVVVTDIELPDGDGIEVTRRAKRSVDPPAVIVVTGNGSVEYAIEALRAGADDFLPKPVQAERLHERTVALAAERRRSRDRITLGLADGARRLALALGVRDEGTGRHSERMSDLCSGFAARLQLPAERVSEIGVASPLHDIGKLAIPDAILQKPGPLDPDEWALMRTHTTVGHRMLSGSGFPVLELAATIALTHHECYDGSGYPHGLAGDEIPLEGRIAMLADVFDALTSDRPYRAALPLDDALVMMRERRGSMFDPRLFDDFVAHVVAPHTERPAGTAGVVHASIPDLERSVTSS
ncbi:MAG: response regulator [Thermoleophilia bacterium]|nr:response regulator [Thermoleophilia bacterium]